jgi:DNA-binding response OmpR family regulator
VSSVAVVEDDARIRAAVSRGLTERGHVVLAASSGLGALGEIVERRPDVVVLDLGLPDIDGLELLRMLRAVSGVPVIVATARDDEREIIRTLDAGADDYVVKPYSAEQLDARIRAVLRRVKDDDGDAPVEVAGLVVDPRSRLATVNGEPVDLSRKEFDLLHLLMREAGAVVTRERLIEDVWETTWFGSTKTLDVHVSSLRKKLGDDPTQPRYVHTLRGVGFRFASADELRDGE